MFSIKKIVFGLMAASLLGFAHVAAVQEASLVGLTIQSQQTLGLAVQPSVSHTFTPTSPVFVTKFGHFVDILTGTPKDADFILLQTGQLTIQYQADSKSVEHGSNHIAITAGPTTPVPVFVDYVVTTTQGAVLNTPSLPPAVIANILAHIPSATVIPSGGIVIRTSDHQDADDGKFDVHYVVSYNWQLFNGPLSCTPGDCGCGGACGDPQFTGFVGQSYQIHGVAGSIYNIISSPSLQVNALFSYLQAGKCRKGTQCFAHPGNYFGEMGFLLSDKNGAVSRVHVIAGPVDVGMRVIMDGVDVATTSPIQVGDSSIELLNPFELDINTPEFAIRLSNSDMFLNEAVSINTPLLQKIQQYKRAAKGSANSTESDSLLMKLPHGLLGQTWQDKTYSNRWKYIDGSLFDYMSSDVFGTSFKHNRFAF